LDRVCWYGIRIAYGCILFDRLFLRKVDQDERVKRIVWGLQNSDGNFKHLDLTHLNLNHLDLSYCSFVSSDLSGSSLCGANLSNSNLKRTQFLDVDLENVTLNGACIEDWNINSFTKLDGVVCEYVYLKANKQERRPREGSFKPGEFAALFQQAVDTVDLIFKDGIDWPG
ncbi:MAG: pentapeptide repeat-containing protein, partial [Cyanobacteria bacterium J06635_1]